MACVWPLISGVVSYYKWLMTKISWILLQKRSQLDLHKILLPPKHQLCLVSLRNLATSFQLAGKIKRAISGVDFRPSLFGFCLIDGSVNTGSSPPFCDSLIPVFLLFYFWVLFCLYRLYIFFKTHWRQCSLPIFHVTDRIDAASDKLIPPQYGSWSLGPFHYINNLVLNNLTVSLALKYCR